jgi:hypothetical protein
VIDVGWIGEKENWGGGKDVGMGSSGLYPTWGIARLESLRN